MILIFSYVLLIIVLYSMYRMYKEDEVLQLKTEKSLEFFVMCFWLGAVLAFSVLNTYYSIQECKRWEHNIEEYKLMNAHPDSLRMQHP